MSRFTEFLQTRAQEEKAKVEANRPVREEWVKAVTELIAQMEVWLSEDDTAHVLAIARDFIEKHEEGLGFYHAPVLRVRHVAREVEIVPVVRIVVSAPADSLLPRTSRPQGRVDITDGATRYKMYRLVDGAESRWVVLEQRHPARLFDRDVFEDIMMDLLQ